MPAKANKTPCPAAPQSIRKVTDRDPPPRVAPQNITEALTRALRVTSRFYPSKSLHHFHCGVKLLQFAR